MYTFEIYLKNPDTLERGWGIVHLRVEAWNHEEAIEYLNTIHLFDRIITDYSL